MAIKSETPQEARERMLRMSEIERAGSAEIASGQAHEKFIQDQQKLATDITEAFRPLDELDEQRAELASKASIDAIGSEQEDGQQSEPRRAGRKGRASSEA